MNPGGQIALRVFACALLILAFAPHHHSGDGAHYTPSHCAACVLMQNSLHSLPVHAPAVIEAPAGTPATPAFAAVPSSPESGTAFVPRAPPR
jgi:hypothetical protein